MSWAFKDSSLEVFANQEYHHKHADLTKWPEDIADGNFLGWTLTLHHFAFSPTHRQRRLGQPPRLHTLDVIAVWEFRAQTSKCTKRALNYFVYTEFFESTQIQSICKVTSKIRIRHLGTKIYIMFKKGDITLRWMAFHSGEQFGSGTA